MTNLKINLGSSEFRESDSRFKVKKVIPLHEKIRRLPKILGTRI